jgi:YcxB-like protein
VRIEFTYRRPPDHYAGHPSVPARPSSSTTSYVIAAVIFLLGGALFVAALVAHAGQAVSCGGLGLLLGASIAVAARQRRRARFVTPPSAMEPRRWIITDDGIEIAHESSSSTMAWAAFRYVLELPHTYLFVLKDQGDRRTFDIPRRPLTAADDEAVRAVITHHGISFYPRPLVG